MELDITTFHNFWPEPHTRNHTCNHNPFLSIMATPNKNNPPQFTLLKLSIQKSANLDQFLIHLDHFYEGDISNLIISNTLDSEINCPTYKKSSPWSNSIRLLTYKTPLFIFYRQQLFQAPTPPLCRKMNYKNCDWAESTGVNFIPYSLFLIPYSLFQKDTYKKFIKTAHFAILWLFSSGPAGAF